jgi:hypothetical protein
LKKLQLKTNLYGGDPESVQEQILVDVENAKSTKNVKMRQTLLGRALTQLQEYEVPEFEPLPNLVPEEVKAAELNFRVKQSKEARERILIATEISKLALEENLVDLAYDSAELGVKGDWDYQKYPELYIAQSESHLILAKCYVEYLLEEEIEIGYADLITVDED